MELNQVTDHHNRRGNIGAVSKWAREGNFPFPVWPEDKLLLKLTDLPIAKETTAEKPKTWETMTPTRVFMVATDEYLRQIIQEGFAYEVLFTPVNLGVYIIREYKIESK